MIRWIPFVFVRIVLFFMAGILTGIYYPDIFQEQLVNVVFITLVVGYCIAAFFNASKINLGLVGLTAVFLGGYTHLLWQTDARNSNHLTKLTQPLDFYQAVITNYPEEKDQSWKIKAKIEHVKIRGNWKRYEGDILLYFPKKYFTEPYHYGDLLIIRGNPKRISPPANPEEFNYQRFLEFKNIYHHHFLKEYDVKFISHNPGNFIWKHAFEARAWCNAILKKYVKGQQEQAIASALVLGVNDGLDHDLLNAYAGTGTLHVLSVSGLHVSIIYMIIVLLTKPLTSRRWGKIMIAVLSISILWAYAFITGLSPSVLRAVMMFSCVALARPWNQQTNIYNTLAISAFFLLLADPYMIMSVGFQLSYLAVLGIVYIQPGLYSLWEPHRRIWDELWKVTTVSLAAQLATFAIGLLYFHQFPNYFLLSNLLVIPASFGVLIAGLAVLTFNFIEPVANLLGFLLEFIIRIMNVTVFSIESFPFSVLNDIHINFFQCLLLMGATLTVILSLQFKRIMYLLASGILMTIFSIVQWVHIEGHMNNSKIIVYNIQGHSAADFLDRGKAYFFADSSLLTDRKKIDFHIKPNRLVQGINREENGSIQIFKKDFQGCSVMRWQGKNILYITDRIFSFPQQLNIDYCIVANNAIRNLEMIKNFNVSKLILDSSNSFYVAEGIQVQAKKLNMNIHSVLHQGAFVATL